MKESIKMLKQISEEKDQALGMIRKYKTIIKKYEKIIQFFGKKIKTLTKKQECISNNEEQDICEECDFGILTEDGCTFCECDEQVIKLWGQ